jgi:formylmethanofuran dehydrogenase subunit E
MVMRAFAEYEKLAAAAQGHMCAGQIGLRLAIHGLELPGIGEPEGRDRKRLGTFVEIGRCATDAIPAETGCRLGKRGRKFLDFGKIASPFCDPQTHERHYTPL